MEITDEYILNEFLNAKLHIKSCKCSKKWLLLHPDINEYLINRYNDSQSIIETIYRIYYHIDIRPVCKYCGKAVRFLNFTTGFRTFCSNYCVLNDKDVQAKRTNTCIERWGVDNAAKSEKIKEQYKETCMKKYGAPSTFLSKIVREKSINTCLEKYGVDNPAKSELVVKLMKETNISKYGNVCPMKNKNVLNKAKLTFLEHYGVESYSLTDEYKQKQSNLMISKEMQERRNKVLHKNHTFNTSKIELEFKKYLELNYPDNFEYQYRSEQYPFNCDFYIKSLNLYIEIQGSWTHGKHPFIENNKDDIEKLNYWKSKNTKYYLNAINVWTILDVNKRNIAQENKLNYLEIFSNNIKECIKIFNEYIKI